ncbi:MAG: mechanosensitive ion channel family protein [Candidatus Sumerlaeota bacterium]
MDWLTEIDFANIIERLGIWQENPIVVKTLHVFLLILALPLSYTISRIVQKIVSKKHSAQFSSLTGKAIFYSACVYVFLSLLHVLEFNLGPILGAAGILGVAIGFASQTSLSNIISGLFLISEKPFVIGDLIEVSGTRGIIMNIDLLSVKLRTFDNRLIRIPNEKLLKENITNVTRYPIRRMDFNIGVAYKEDTERVREILLDIARKNILVLDEPEPFFLFREYGESALLYLFGVWFAAADFVEVHNQMLIEIKKRFDEEGIEIPFPHRTIYTGAATRPFPVHMEGASSSPSESGTTPDA